MSRIGKQEIAIPTGVKVTQSAGIVTVTGQKGALSKNFRDDITIAITDKAVNLNVKRLLVCLDLTAPAWSSRI